MLHAKVYLDSVDLVDLGTLFERGVHRSDCIIVLGTANVLTRPWVCPARQPALPDADPAHLKYF